MATRRELTFDDYLAIFRRRCWLIIIPSILGIPAGIILSVLLPPKYRSHTLILVEQPALMGMSPQLEVATQARQDKAFTESLLNQQLAALKSSKESKDPQTLEQQLRELQNQLQSLEGHYTVTRSFAGSRFSSLPPMTVFPS